LADATVTVEGRDCNWLLCHCMGMLGGKICPTLVRMHRNR
jgi:hypothetical protein